MKKQYQNGLVALKPVKQNYVKSMVVGSLSAINHDMMWNNVPFSPHPSDADHQ
jgi:hypothetical protein